MFKLTEHFRGLTLVLTAMMSQAALAELPQHPVAHIFSPSVEETTGPDGTPVSTRFGTAVAIRNNIAVIGMGGIGKVAVFQRTTSGWTRAGELSPPQPAVNYGWGVAYRDNTIIVAAQHALYVYKLSNGAWLYVNQLAPPPGDVMGIRPHTLSFQDNTVAMGYTHEDARGSVYVYELSTSGQLLRRVKLQPHDSAWNDGFGFDVAMSSKTLVIGSPHTGGAAYIFKRNTRSWYQFQKLTGTDSHFEGFGGAVAINNGVIAIGAASEDLAGLEGEPARLGAVFIFSPTASGTFVERQRIRPSSDEWSNFELFGYSIYMSGNRLAVGAQMWIGDPPEETSSGLIFTYILSNGQATPHGVAVSEALEWHGGFSNNMLLVGTEYPDCNFDVCLGQGTLFDVSRFQ